MLLDRIKEYKEATQQCFSPPQGAQLSPRAPRSLTLQGTGTPSQAESQGCPGSHESPAAPVAAGWISCWVCLGKLLTVPLVDLSARGLCQERVTQVRLFCSQLSSSLLSSSGKQSKLLQESEVPCSPGFHCFQATSWSNFY